MCTCALGWTVDKFSIFGDGSSVVTSNAIQNVLIWLVRWLIMLELQLGDDCRLWVARLLAQPFMTETMRRWVSTRASIFKCPDAPSWKQLTRPAAEVQMKRFWNLVPLAVCAYFDDKMSGGGLALSDMFSSAVWRLVSEGRVLDSVAKAVRSTEGGDKYIVEETGDTRKWVPDPDVLPGTWHPLVLGKEFVIALQLRRDSAERIRMVIWLTMQVIQIAGAAPTRLVLMATLERLRGQWNFVLDSSKGQRALLSSLTACIIVGLRLGRKEEAFASKALARLETAKAASMASLDDYDLQWQEWGLSFFAPVSHKCEHDLLSLCGVIRSTNAAAWAPRRSPVPLHEQVWIMADSAGFSKDAAGTVDFFRFAACWVWAARFDECPYMQELWDTAILERTHSTAQESANVIACLKAAAADYPWATFFWVVCDSQASMFLCRRLAARKSGMDEAMEALRELILGLARRGVRVGFLWTRRTGATIPDDISKDEMAAARRSVLLRCPSQPLAAAPTAREHNVLNQPNG